MAQKNTKSQGQSTAKSASVDHAEKTIDNDVIIWLDPNLDFSNEENQEFISELQSVVNIIKTFNDLDQCVQYLGHIKTEKVFLIISDYYLKQIVSLEEQFTQLYSIYIFCKEKSKFDQLIKTYKKGRGVFTQITALCNELRKDVRQLTNNSVPFSVVSTSSITNLNELDPLFMYFQLLKENFLAIQYDRDMGKQQLIDYFSPVYRGDKFQTKRIAEFKENYGIQSPIWWYTLESFIYNKLNYALRTMNIEVLIQMGFFIRDLHEQIKQLHSELDLTQIPSTVYRGQGMSNSEFEKLRKAPGGFLSFNIFLSTSVKKSVAEEFALNNLSKPDLVAILFEIQIDTLISSIPFSPIKHLSAIPIEEEILFSMATVFRIAEIDKTENNLWKVRLSLTSERDPLLKRLTDHMRISLGGGNGWRPLGQLMIKMGQFDKAMEIYQILLKTVDPDDKAENAFLHNQLGYLCKQKEQLDEAFAHYENARNIYLSYMSDTDPRLSSVYSNIGAILKKSGDTNGALKYFELVLKIDRAATKPNPLEIAVDHNNIGSVLDDQGKHHEALNSYNEALKIKLSHLPPHHPSLASTYSNIGLIHRKLGDCSTALSFYEKTLQIQQKSLPPNHPSLVVTYGKMANVLEELHRYEEAIKHAQRAVEIADKAYGSSHPETEKRRKYRQELQQKTLISLSENISQYF